MSTDFYSNMQVCMRLRGMEASDLKSHDLDVNQIDNALNGIIELDSKGKALIAEKLGMEVKFLQEDYISEAGAEEAFREIYEYGGIALVAESSDSDLQDQSASPEPAKEDSSAEVEDDSTKEESDSETIVVGGVEYDLTDKEVRKRFREKADKLRDTTVPEFVESFGTDRSASWWGNLQYGNAGLLRSDVEAITKRLGVSAVYLLDVSDPGQEARADSQEASKPELAEEATSEVPESEEEPSSTESADEVDAEPVASEDPPAEEKSEPISEPEVEEVVVEETVDSEESTEPSEGFRDLFLRLETSPAEGFTTGELLVVAGEGRPTDSAWGEAWFTMTAEGVSAARRVDELMEEVLGMDDPVRKVLLDRIAEKTSNT